MYGRLAESRSFQVIALIVFQFLAIKSANRKYETGCGMLSGLRRPPGRARLCVTAPVQPVCFHNLPTDTAWEANDRVLKGGGNSLGK
jgi:hypothetical protein